MVVKKTFRYSNVFFYNHLCCNSLFRNIIMKSGIKDLVYSFVKTVIVTAIHTIQLYLGDELVTSFD